MKRKRVVIPALTKRGWLTLLVSPGVCAVASNGLAETPVVCHANAEDSLPADPRTTPELIATLSGFIFPERLRNELKGIQSLSVAPIRNMSSVPLAILQPFGDTRQVVDLFSVNFVAFATDLQNGSVPSRSTYPNALIIGNPRPSDDPEWMFPELPSAEKENSEH